MASLRTTRLLRSNHLQSCFNLYSPLSLSPSSRFLHYNSRLLISSSSSTHANAHSSSSTTHHSNDSHNSHDSHSHSGSSSGHYEPPEGGNFLGQGKI